MKDIKPFQEEGRMNERLCCKEDMLLYAPREEIRAVRFVNLFLKLVRLMVYEGGGNELRLPISCLHHEVPIFAQGFALIGNDRNYSENDSGVCPAIHWHALVYQPVYEKESASHHIFIGPSYQWWREESEIVAEANELRIDYRQVDVRMLRKAMEPTLQGLGLLEAKMRWAQPLPVQHNLIDQM